MNILFINTSRTWGGNEKWTSLAAHRLSREHNVFLAYRSEKLGRRFSICKERFLFFNRLDMLTLFRLVRFIKNNNINTIVSTNRKYYLLGATASRLAACRHFVRCGIVWDIPDNAYYRFLFTRLIDGIVVNARPIQNRLLQSGFIRPDQVHLIYNGLDLEKLDEGRNVQADKPFPFTIVTCGELTPRKGNIPLIKSFAHFVKKYGISDAGLVIIGQGRQKQELADLALDLDIAGQVIFAGFLDNPYPLVATADLYVTLSSNEGISNSLLEAMYLKVPVISSPAGGAGEFIKNGYNGFLVDQASGRALSDLFSRVYYGDREQNLRMADEGRKTAAGRFSLEVMTKSLEKAFMTALNA